MLRTQLRNCGSRRFFIALVSNLAVITSCKGKKWMSIMYPLANKDMIRHNTFREVNDYERIKYCDCG